MDNIKPPHYVVSVFARYVQLVDHLDHWINVVRPNQEHLDSNQDIG